MAKRLLCVHSLKPFNNSKIIKIDPTLEMRNRKHLICSVLQISYGSNK